MDAVRTAPAGQPVLRAEAVSKRYGSRWALRDVTLGAAAGERIALIGPNGAGKTTLLQILAGSLAPTAGTVHVGERVGWVPQQAAVYGKLTVEENLRLFARLEKVADCDAAVSRMLDQTGLRERSADPVATLSGGNRQRVNIAVGLLAEPPVVLLDEPSSSLDPRQREVLWRFVVDLPCTTVIYTTHDVTEAKRYADRVAILADGELLWTGTADELEAAAGDAVDFEAAFVRFLRERGH